jgi:hypothetical protein
MIASHSSFPMRIVQPVPSRSRRTNTPRGELSQRRLAQRGSLTSGRKIHRGQD